METLSLKIRHYRIGLPTAETLGQRNEGNQKRKWFCVSSSEQEEQRD